MCEGKIDIEKGPLIRFLTNNYATEGQGRNTTPQEEVPYIVNELAYYIVNNGINIFKAFNP